MGLTAANLDPRTRNAPPPTWSAFRRLPPSHAPVHECPLGPPRHRLAHLSFQRQENDGGCELTIEPPVALASVAVARAATAYRPRPQSPRHCEAEARTNGRDGEAPHVQRPRSSAARASSRRRQAWRSGCPTRTWFIRACRAGRGGGRDRVRGRRGVRVCRCRRSRRVIVGRRGRRSVPMFRLGGARG